MHVVRQHAARPEQPVPVVGVGVVRVLREEPAHGVDLGAVLVDVRGEQRAVDVAEHRRARLQHRLAGGQREPRRDGVAQPVLAVPPRRERDRVGVRLLRGGQQLGAQQPVADDEPGADPQPDRRRPLEELVDRGREVRAEHQRGRRPRRAPARRRTPRPPSARSRRRPSGPPPATRTPPASRAAACRGRRSPAPAGSARGCRPGRAAARRRSGRPPRSSGRAARTRANGPRSTTAPAATAMPQSSSARSRPPVNGESGVSRTVAR